MTEPIMISEEEVIARGILRKEIRASLQQEINRLFFDDKMIEGVIANVKKNISYTIEKEISKNITFALQAEMERILSDKNTLFRIMEKAK